MALKQDRPAGVAAAGGRVFYGWVLVGCFWLVLIGNLAFPTYGGAVLNAAMAAHIGLSRQMLGLIYSVFLGVIGLASPLVAQIINRFGVRRTLVAGNLAVALGAAAMAALVHTGVAALVVFGGVIGFGVASGGNLTAQTAIPRWFVRRRALAFALMLSGAALGGAAAAPLTAALLKALGDDWRSVWWALAALALAVAAVAGLLVREAPSDVGQAPDGGVETARPARTAGGRSWTLQMALLSWRFWVIGLSSACGTGAFGVVLAHAAISARDAGYTPSQAAYALGLISVTGLFGKGLSALGDRLNPAKVWAGLMGCMALGLAIAALGMAHGRLYPFAVLFGIGLGGFIVCQPTTVADIFGSKDFARIAGAVFFIQALAGMAMPWLVGWSFDVLGTYGPGFGVLAAACAASAVLLSRLRTPASNAEA